MSGIDCKMCCNSYNTFERRPLVLPCGHTFCSSCICVPIKEEKFTCYTCHVEHTVNSSTIFPVNFEVENILHRFATKDSNPFSGATSEMRLNREAIESSFQEANSQLQYYKTHLESWEKGCQREFQEHMEFVDRIGIILKWITEETFRVDGTLHEGKKKMQEVKDSQENLDEARGAQNFFEAFQKVYERYDSFDSWVRHVRASFPDKKRLQKSRQLPLTSLRKEGTPASVKSEDAAFDEKRDVCPGACSDALEGVAGDSFSSLSINDKIEKVLDFFPDRRRSQSTQTHEAEFLRETDLSDISPFTEEMLRQGRVFAAETDKDKGTTRYARISLDKSDRLWLHVLGNPEEIPCDSFVLQYKKVTKLYPYDPCFLDLGEGERSFGRLVLSLRQRSSAAMQFSKLCTGTQGPSYLNTNMIKLENDEKCQCECAYFGDYENNDGSGGKALRQGVDWKADAIRKGNNGPCVLYSVRATSQDESKATQFHIFTKTTARVAPISSGFIGMVVDGAQVLTEAISQCPDVRRIYVKDCGVLIRNNFR